MAARRPPGGAGEGASMSPAPTQPDLVAILRRLTSDNPDERIAAAGELERLRSKAGPAIAALTHALDDTDPRVVLAATRALRRSLGRWQTDQIIFAEKRTYIATARLERAVGSTNGHPDAHPDAPTTPP